MLRAEPAIIFTACSGVYEFRSSSLIFAISYFGRELQSFWKSELAWLPVGPTMLACLALMGASAVKLARPSSGSSLLSWAWIPLVILAIAYFVPIAEDRMHFVLFGGFGFFVGRSLSAAASLVWILCLSFADEGVQASVPDRYFSWKDIGMNLVGGCLGYLARRQARRASHRSLSTGLSKTEGRGGGISPDLFLCLFSGSGSFRKNIFCCPFKTARLSSDKRILPWPSTSTTR